MQRNKPYKQTTSPLLASMAAAFLLVSAVLTPALAQPAVEKLRVAVKPAAPFAIQNSAGEWSGISVELWRDIAKQLNMSFEWVPVDTVGAQIESLEKGEADIAVGAITVTAQREQKIDFSNPFYNTGLGVAINAESSGLLATVMSFISLPFLKAVAVLGTLLLIIGFLIWLLERRRNEQFGGSAARGIGNGFWWSAVTMTTVGYGDKAPVTFAGRVLGVVWMFVSIITISGFTAAIASSFTLNQLSSKVENVSDLYRVRTATVANSSSSDFLRDINLTARRYDTAEAALNKVDNNQLDAVVYDKPLLQFLLTQLQLKNVKILPLTLTKQDYALALQDQSPHREAVNRALLQIVQSDSWEARLKKYLGE